MSYSSIYYYAIIVNSRMIVGISFNKDFIIIIIDTIVFSALSLSPPPLIVFSFHLGSGISQLTKHERKQRKLPGTQANGFVTCSFSTKDCGGLRDEPKERLRRRLLGPSPFSQTYSLFGLFDRLSIACLFLFWETSCITVDGMLAAGEHVTGNKEEVNKTEKEETMIDCEIMKRGIN